jgi:hypothetical protein
MNGFHFGFVRATASVSAEGFLCRIQLRGSYKYMYFPRIAELGNFFAFCLEKVPNYELACTSVMYALRRSASFRDGQRHAQSPFNQVSQSSMLPLCVYLRASTVHTYACAASIVLCTVLTLLESMGLMQCRSRCIHQSWIVDGSSPPSPPSTSRPGHSGQTRIESSHKNFIRCP